MPADFVIHGLRRALERAPRPQPYETKCGDRGDRDEREQQRIFERPLTAL